MASGLSAQDILARPAMLGPGRGQHTSVVQLPSMQRTNKLQLEPEVAARIAAKTSYETPADSVTEPRPVLRTEIPEPAMVKPGAATTKWIPPEEFAPRLLPPTVVPATGSEPDSSRPAPSSPGVDATMDDSQIPTRAALLSTPGPTSAPPSRQGETAPPMSRVPPAPPSSKPASLVDSTIAGDEAPVRTPRPPPPRGRTPVVILACFLVGVLGMGGLAFKAGLIGGHARDRLDYAGLASDALTQQKWEAVRDLTDKGLTRTPNDPALLQLRVRASAEALDAARAKAAGGDTQGAVKVAELAAQLDPSAAGPGMLLETLAAPAPTAEVEPSIPPLASGRTTPSATGTASSPRATLDVSNAKPGVGQPVDLSARVAAGARAKVDGAAFHIAGPGIAPGTRLDASDDGSAVFRATFTFLQAGRFEVTFTARADGSQVRSARSLVVGGATPLPASSAPGPAAPAPPRPVPTDSAKWL